jgi:hypothetical protein
MTWSTISPARPEGWDGFDGSNALTELLWLRLTGWHYLNSTSTTSVWEDPAGSGAMLHVAYAGEKIVDLTVDLASDDGPGADTLRGLIAELESTCALRVGATA